MIRLVKRHTASHKGSLRYKLWELLAWAMQYLMCNEHNCDGQLHRIQQAHDQSAAWAPEALVAGEALFGCIRKPVGSNHT